MKIILIVIMLSACAMSNDEIIADIERCHKAGLSLSIHRNAVGEITSLQCVQTPATHQNGGV